MKMGIVGLMMVLAVMCFGTYGCASRQILEAPSAEKVKPQKIVLPLPRKEVWASTVRTILLDGGEIQSFAEDEGFINYQILIPAVGVVSVGVNVQDSGHQTMLEVAAFANATSADMSAIVIEKLKASLVPVRYEWLR